MDVLQSRNKVHCKNNKILQKKKKKKKKTTTKVGNRNDLGII